MHKSGPALDFGCENGFLLRDLQEWSPHNPDLRGFDINKDLLDNMGVLFANTSESFFEIKQLLSETIPKFSYIYWNVWDNSFLAKNEYDLFNMLLEIIDKGRGRLALDFYDALDSN